MILSTIFSFLGGSVFRMLWGEISSFINNAGIVSSVVWGFNIDKSTSGFLSLLPATNLPKLTTKAWGRFTVAGGAIASTNLQGVASVAYISAGTYEVVLSTAQAGTDYAITASAENGAIASMFLCSPTQPISTTTFRLITSSISGVPADARTVSFQVHS